MAGNYETKNLSMIFSFAVLLIAYHLAIDPKIFGGEIAMVLRTY